MAISDTQKVDLLFKKLAFGLTKTDTPGNKSPANESISSPLPVYGNLIWTNASSIPAIPPGTDTAAVQTRTGAGGAVKLKVDPSVPSNSAWIAVEDPEGDLSEGNRLRDWIPFSFGSQYAVKVWVGGAPGFGTQIFPDATNQEYYFDYQAGVLNFPTNLPAGVNGSADIYLEGYRYIGVKGIGGESGISSKTHLADDIAARDALDVTAGDIVYVANAGNGEWAAYIATTDGTGATYVQLVDQDASDVDARTYSEVITSASAATITMGTVSANKRPVSVAVDVTAQFDGTATVTVGDSGDNDRLMGIDENDLQATPFTYMTTPVYEYTSDTDLVIYFNAGGATQGEATVTVTYA